MSTTSTTTIPTVTPPKMKIALDNSLEEQHTPSARLPVELLQHIIAQINDRGSLHALTLSSHFLRYEAEPLLYASPMSPYPSPDLPTPHPASRSTANNDPSTHLSFLRTVCTNSRLALLVRSYHSPSVLRHSDTPLWRYTARAFRMMKGLKELRLRTFIARPAARLLLLGKDHHLYLEEDNSYRGDWRYEWELSRSGPGDDEGEGDQAHGPESGPTFQLHTFHWGCHWDNKGVTAFLQTQNTLSALIINDNQNLSIYVEGLGDTGMGRVRMLEFHASVYHATFYRLAALLVGLEVLELVDCHEEDLTALQSLPSLRELILSSPKGARKPPIPLPALFFFALPASGPLHLPLSSPSSPSQSHNHTPLTTPRQTLRPSTSTIPPLPIVSLFESCAKLECVDVALCVHLIPSVIMADFVRSGGGAAAGEEVRLYARWKGRKRWWLDGGSGEKKGFELLSTDDVRRARLMANWSRKTNAQRYAAMMRSRDEMVQ